MKKYSRKAVLFLRLSIEIIGFLCYHLYGYIEVIDLNDWNKRAIIQDGQIVESVMEDSENDIVMDYYEQNRQLMEESLYA